MEKRVLLAALLSAAFLALYSKVLTTWYPSPPARSQEVAAEKPAPTLEAAAQSLYHLEDEDVVSIESESMELEIGKSSGAIRRITLKQFMDEAGQQPLRIISGLHLVHLQIDDRPLSWRALETTPTSATFEASDADLNSYHIRYSVDMHNPLVMIELDHINGASSSARALVVTSTWTKADELDNRRNPLEINMLVENGNGGKKHLRYFGPIKQAKNVPRGTLLVSLAERYFCQSVRPGRGTAMVRLLPSREGTIAVESMVPLNEAPGDRAHQSIAIYAGARDYFRMKRAGFSDAFPVGVVGQIGLIMLSFLKLLAGLT